MKTNNFIIRTSIVTISFILLVVSSAYTGDEIPSLNWKQRSDWINVKENGAKGDGYTDDTKALQSVLDQVKSGSIIYFPPGIYRITETLSITGPALGTALLGHGKDTCLRWDGKQGGQILKVDGLAQNARYEGFVFDGAGKADIGLWHVNNTRFETEVLHRNLHFKALQKSGIHMELNWRDQGDKYATAEVVFRNCLFEDCATGVWVGSFNDYNHTYEGCEFRRCGIGVYYSKGNFYIRNSHFEESREADIVFIGEHGASVRRVSSWKSKCFVKNFSSVAPLILEDCHIGAWTAGEKGIGEEGCPIIHSGCLMLMFDCSFESPPDARPPVYAKGKIIHSGCKTPDGIALFGILRGRSPSDIAFEKKVLDTNVISLPDDDRQTSRLTARTKFLKQEWKLPGKIFDAKLDFGAKGDGKSDDTRALQNLINTTKEYGNNAIAYIPFGTYTISESLHMEGSNYVVGGCGTMTRIVWKGSKGAAILKVENPENLRLENIMIGHHDAELGENSIDILHTDTRPSSMQYEAVYVFGMYQKKPFERGFLFRNLSKDSVVILDRVNGNLRFTECGRATIFSPVSYEGSLVIDGKRKERDGFMGFMTRMSTVVAGALYLMDNNSVVISDLYIEQSDGGYYFEGVEGLPPGRATIQAPKLHLSEKLQDPPPIILIKNYAGEIIIGPAQFSYWPSLPVFKQEGMSPLIITLFGSKFYESIPKWSLEGPNARLALFGNEPFGKYDKIAKKTELIKSANANLNDNANEKDIKTILNAFKDLRQLGEVDLKLNDYF